jgi:CRP-like cAMP-binding protein
MCFILKGILRVYYIDRSGNEINQHFYQANEVLSPISALISDEPCQYYIQALEPCELMLANYHDLNNISIVQPQWLQLEVKLLQTVFIKNAKREAATRMACGDAQGALRTGRLVMAYSYGRWSRSKGS